MILKSIVGPSRHLGVRQARSTGLVANDPKRTFQVVGSTSRERLIDQIND
jgi:hypothetical protein